MANLEAGLGAQARLRAGYRVTGREFSGLPELDHLERDAFASLLLNLPSRTTLLGEAHLGVKTYGAAARAGMLTFIGRAAQSLADRTGVAVQVSGRLTSGDVPPLLVTTPPAFLDDGVYDDPFASDALAAGVSLKRVFASGAVLEAEGSWQRKDYVATLALDAAGEPVTPAALRRDETWRAQARASVPVWPDRTGGVAVRVELAYGYLDRASNDAFHDDSAHAVSAGVSLAY